MSESSKRILTRREALRLSATAGMSMVAGERALASDSIKTAARHSCRPKRAVLERPCPGQPRLLRRNSWLRSLASLKNPT
jgi:hypothetical protein